jgi:S-adenosylmethionine:tRNA ribosyltransferase-isomerase
LHVGPGTFLPVRSDDVRRHRVLAERYEVSETACAALASARAAGRPIIAVGTTVCRTLETIARDGLQARSGHADLTILPGHRFELVSGLMTNFHLPRSSLLLLVAAFAGYGRTMAYRAAVAAGYRFYSYGDASLWL